jgi:hypothetical protein
MSRQVEIWDLPEDEWPLELEVATWGGEAPSAVLSNPPPQASADHSLNQLNQLDSLSGEEPDAEPQLPLASGSSLPEHRPTQVNDVIAASSSKRKPSKELKFDSDQPLKSRLAAVEVQCVPFALFFLDT